MRLMSTTMCGFQPADTPVAQLVKGALAAKRRFAVAAEMMGKIVHSHIFDLSDQRKQSLVYAGV